MPAQPRLILASASPRRRELLKQAGFDFLVHSEPVDEDALAKEENADAGALALKLATAKAEAVADLFPGAVVLGADTVVVLERQIFGKPHDEKEACVMLTTLSGRTHRVLTAVFLCEKERRTRIGHVETTNVTFFPYDKEQASLIRRYAAGGSPLDKAGAYGIQDEGALLISRIEGDYNNVVGLPLAQVARLLARHFNLYPADF